MHFSGCILKTKTWISDLYLISNSIKWYRCESNRPIFKWSHLKALFSEYRLVSIISHYGSSLTSGHYRAQVYR